MGMTPLLYYQSLSQCTHWATTPCSLALIHPKIHHSPNIQSNLDIAVHGSPGIWRWREAVGACRYEDTCLDAMVYTTLALIKFSSTYSWEICQYRQWTREQKKNTALIITLALPPPSLVLSSAREYTNNVLMHRNSAKPSIQLYFQILPASMLNDKKSKVSYCNQYHGVYLC